MCEYVVFTTSTAERERDWESMTDKFYFAIHSAIQQTTHSWKKKKKRARTNWIGILDSRCSLPSITTEFGRRAEKNTNKLIKVIGLLINIFLHQKYSSKQWREEKITFRISFCHRSMETHPTWNRMTPDT